MPRQSRRVYGVGDKVGMITLMRSEMRMDGQVRRTFWLCHCECGNEVWRKAGDIPSCVSCGCVWKSNISGALRTTHGMKHRAEYVLWQHIKGRCERPNTAQFEDWGGRGITMCQRWKDSFEDFLADVGCRPSPQHSLDRWPNNDGNYEPGNVRWATRQQQNENRRSVKRLYIDGRLVTLKEAARLRGVNYGTAKKHYRLRATL